MALNRNWRRQIKPDKSVMNKLDLITGQLKKESLNLPKIDKFKIPEFMSTLDQHYTALSPHVPIKIDRSHTVQLTAFEQIYFEFDVRSVSFPLRFSIENLFGRGTVYIGYDQEYPGVVVKQEKIQNEYRYKFLAIQNKSWCLTKKIQEKVNKVFITASSASSMLMFDLKIVETTELEEKKLSSLAPGASERKIRKCSENLKRVESKSKLKYNASLQRMKTEGSSDLSIKLDDEIARRMGGMKVVASLDERKNTKDFILLNEVSVECFRKTRVESFKIIKREKNNQCVMRAKCNLSKLELLKEKERELATIATKFKSIIALEEDHFNKKEENRKKYIKTVIVSLFSSIFCRKVVENLSKFKSHADKTFQAGILAKRFANKVMKKTKQSKKDYDSSRKTNLVTTFHFLQAASKCLNRQEKKKASSIVINTFENLRESLQLNHALQKANKLKKAVRVIEYHWLRRHKARMSILKKFSANHILQMFTQHPHLKLFAGKFEAGSMNATICLRYLGDQALKFRQIRQKYLSKMQEIRDINEKNKQIREYNSKNALFRNREELKVPAVPVRPHERVFRDLDILRTMIRSYFELEYKRMLKKKS